MFIRVLLISINKFTFLIVSMDFLLTISDIISQIAAIFQPRSQNLSSKKQDVVFICICISVSIILVNGNIILFLV